jgi:hypothetical protein
LPQCLVEPHLHLSENGIEANSIDDG